MYQEKKNKIITAIIVSVFMIIILGTTFAYLPINDAENTNFRTSATTNTIDSLIFNVTNNISFTASPTNFNEGMGNREGIATASAVLKANNKTNSATKYYYLYLDIKENELIYTTDDNTAELLLQVTGPDGLVTTINGLNYVTVTDGLGEQVSGFDITEIQDLITIASNKEITTTSEKTDNWEIKVILVNLNEDQSGNGGKKFNGEIILQKEEIVFPNLVDYIKNTIYTGIQGENNIYYHKNLANSAEDDSYRYAGSYESVNNYVCFGSDKRDCPWDNLYRIIGVFGDKVKLIKADYAKFSELGTNGDYADAYGASIEINKGKNINEEIGRYYWNYNNGNVTNANNWVNSKLNKENLNGTYLNSFNDTWKNKIVETVWKVGGNTDEKIYYTTPSNSYRNEIINPSKNTTEIRKIGLLYVSDYLFGASPENWTKHANVDSGHTHSSGNWSKEYDYTSSTNTNWLHNGLYEWTITRIDNINGYISNIYAQGYIQSNYAAASSYAVRPCFYLTPEVTLTSGSGSQSNPYRIS